MKDGKDGAMKAKNEVEAMNIQDVVGEGGKRESSRRREKREVKEKERGREKNLESEIRDESATERGR